MRNTEAYKIAKATKVGEFITCPACSKRFIKEFYNQVFCTNAKTKLRNNCKDRYWNNIDPKKRCNTTRISPANFAYYHNVIIPRRDVDFDDDQGWDAHKDSF